MPTFSKNSWRRGTPKKRARVYDPVFAYALPHSHANGGVVLVDLRRVGLSHFSVGAPIWRDVHGSLDLYFRHNIANVLAACHVNVCQQRISHGGDDQRPESHTLLPAFALYAGFAKLHMHGELFKSRCDIRSRPPIDSCLRRSFASILPGFVVPLQEYRRFLRVSANCLGGGRCRPARMSAASDSETPSAEAHRS